LRPRSFALALALTAVAGPAAAHGRFPAASQLIVQRTDPNRLVLRTTFGILFSSDRGANWDWICEEAVGCSSSEDPSLGVTASGAIVAGMSGGLVVSPDRGCAWNHVAALTKEFVVDVTVRPDQLRTALAATNTYVGQNGAGTASYDSRIFVSNDDGATWVPQGTALDPSLLIEAIGIAKSDPNRLYVSAKHSLPTSDGGVSAEGVLLVSKDSGATWTRRPVPLIPGEERPQIAAVDPQNADRVYVRTSGTGAGRLLVSNDAGQTYSVRFTGTGALAAFALNADGSKLYVGGERDGVNVASTTDFVFRKTSGIKADCFALDGSTLYACGSDGIDHFTLGSSTDDGATFTPLLHLSTVRGLLACGSASPTAQCAAIWPAIQATLGGGPTPNPGPDANVGAGAETDAGVPQETPSSAMCGCRSGERGSSSSYAGLAVLVLVVALRLRNRPSRKSR
jgi:MYXO-CTERM domain-containing protein